jgi:precorrin-6Y C5,15-methyltransferase (decarboxylating)
LTVHGRAAENVTRHIAPGARLIILAHDGSTPAAVRDVLLAQGFGESRIVALAHMGGTRECRREALARDFDTAVPDFHTLCVECVAAPNAIWHPRIGVPDDAFANDGKLTKREVRSTALAKLKPHAGALLVDVGAGCGSVAIEWLRAEDHTEAIALEPLADRRAMAARNAAALGVPHLDIRDGHAPEALAGMPEPDAIFIGGGVSDATIEAARDKLKPDGRLVAHAVTLESESVLLSAYARHGGELVRIAITRAEPIGAFTGWRPAMPVTQWAWRKT